MKVFVLGLFLVTHQVDEKHISSLIDLLEEKDEQIRNHVYNELLAKGSDIIPLLEKKLELKGTLTCYKLIKDIELKRNPTKAVLDTDLPDPASYKKQLKKIDKNELSNFYLTKYIEAYELMRAGDLSPASEIISSLLKLERTPPYYNELCQLKAYCDQKLMQSNVVAAKVVLKKKHYLPGEKIELEFVFENKTKDKLKIDLTKNPQIFIQVHAQAFALSGVEHSITKQEMVQIEKSIELEKDKTHSISFAIDTSGYQFNSNLASAVKYFYIWAYFSPTDLSYESVKTGTKIVPFIPSTGRVFTKETAALLIDPIKSLKESIDKEKLNDIFYLLLAIDDERKGQLMSSMIELMPKISSNQVLTAIFKSLERVTGKKFGTIKEWQDWLKNSR